MRRLVSKAPRLGMIFHYDPLLLVGQSSEQILQSSIDILTDVNWEVVEINQLLRDCAAKMGISNKDFFGILRIAITGKRISLPLVESMVIIGRERTLARLRNAAVMLDNMKI